MDSDSFAITIEDINESMSLLTCQISFYISWSSGIDPIPFKICQVVKCFLNPPSQEVSGAKTKVKLKAGGEVKDYKSDLVTQVSAVYLINTTGSWQVMVVKKLRSRN